MTQRDLKAIHKDLKKNTAAAIDKQNLDFAKWLESGYVSAKKMVDEVNSFEGYASVLNFYAGGFRDEHIQLPFYIKPTNYLWPGFMISFDNDRFVVSSVIDSQKEPLDLPKVEDQVLKIDGVPIKKALIDRVFKYHVGVPSMESDIGNNTPYILLDDRSPFLKQPKTCTILSDGKTKTIPLLWKKISLEKASKLILKAKQRPSFEFGIRDFMGKKGAWISLPTFSPKNDQDIEKLHQIIEATKNLRDRKIVVIDVRGNGGGSSIWGSNLIKALYGKDFAGQITDKIYKKEFSEYRVSEGNLRYFKNTLLPVVSKSDTKGDIYKEVSALIKRMEKALKQGSPTLVRMDNPMKNQEKKKKSSSQKPPFQGTVVFITDWTCSSACLTFATELLLMPNVLHVGKPTHGNSYYLEARAILLPSKMASIVFPMNIERGRKRGFNEVYIPKQRYPSNLNDTPALEAWIQTLLTKTQN